MNVLHMYRRTLLGLFLLIAPLAFSGCIIEALVGDPAPPPKIYKAPKPIRITKSETIGFQKLIYRIPRGKKAFVKYNIYGKSMYKDTWKQGISIGGYEERELINNELRAWDYNVLGTENILFDEDQSAKARFQLGGIVEDAQFNYYVQVPKDRVEDWLVIHWQLHDTLHKKVVYSKKTEGVFVENIDELNMQHIMEEIFRDSLRRVLEDKQFVDIVCGTSQDVSNRNVSKGSIGKPLTILSNTPASRRKCSIEELMNGVVLIRVGKIHATGFFISPDGYILTASHVVSDVDKVSIVTKAGQKLQARVIRADKAQDIALIKVSGTGYPSLSMETRKQPEMGTELYAIGSPLSTELSFSVSQGIVSGYRKINGFEYIQTDASLNVGNSGGPMLTKDGKVVGIVSWKINIPGVEGLAFGVPSNLVASRLNLNWDPPRQPGRTPTTAPAQ